MGLISFSALSAHNKAEHNPFGYRMPVEAPAPFKPGDVAPCVVYNALVGTEGKSLRSVAQRTRARVETKAVVLDTFDPLIDVTRTGGDLLFELVGYLLDASGKEHETFTIKFLRDRPALGRKNV
jgi:hypothetical protein